MEACVHYVKPRIERTALVGQLQVIQISVICICPQAPCKCAAGAI